NYQQRIEQAHDASGDTSVVRGDLLPITKLVKDGEIQSRHFDLESGVTGDIKRLAHKGHDIRTGKLPLYLPDGSQNPEAGSVAAEMAMAFTPAGVGARIAKKAIPALTRQQQAAGKAQQRVDAAGDFGINLSRGQATDDIPIQAFEQDALTGGRGLPAQSAYAQQRARQENEIGSAINSLRDRVAPGQSDDAIEAAEYTGAAVADKAARLKEISKKYYDRADESGTVIPSDAMETLSQRIATQLEDNIMLVDGEVADGLPNISRIKARLDKLTASKDAETGLDWRHIEKVR
ncbi:MAG: hypothetical protein GY941_26620, partial [Planctomycetes bacterium]|nr:hypothetical protein [Planctomycetota bacterium]